MAPRSSTDPHPPRQLTRRDLLRVLGGAAVGGPWLVGCQGRDPFGPDPFGATARLALGPPSCGANGKRPPLVVFVPGWLDGKLDYVVGFLEEEINQRLQTIVPQVVQILEWRVRFRGIEVVIRVDFGSILRGALAGVAKGTLLHIVQSWDLRTAYFRSQKDRLDELGIEWQDMNERPPFNSTNNYVVCNADAIVALLRECEADGRRAILMSHSKGCQDTLDALTRVGNEDLWNTVQGWVALQSSYFESEFRLAPEVPGPCTYAKERPALDPELTAAPVTFCGCGPGDYSSLTTAEHEHLSADQRDRVEYMNAQSQTIQALTEAVPIVSCFSAYTPFVDAEQLARQITTRALATFRGGLRSWARDCIWSRMRNRPKRELVVRSEWDGAVRRCRDLAVDRIKSALQKEPLAGVALLDLPNLATHRRAQRAPEGSFRCGANDGLVPARAARLPGATIRDLGCNTDHAAPAFDWPIGLRNLWTPEERNAITLGLLLEAAGLASLDELQPAECPPPIPDPAAGVPGLRNDVQALLDSGVLTPQQAGPLFVKLEAALSALARNNVVAASNALGAFMNQVEALVNSRQLTQAEGKALLDGAQEVIGALATR